MATRKPRWNGKCVKIEEENSFTTSSLSQLSDGRPGLVKVDAPHQKIYGKITLFIPLLHKLRMERTWKRKLIRCMMVELIDVVP
jgi:hypothetical protein